MTVCHKLQIQNIMAINMNPQKKFDFRDSYNSNNYKGEIGMKKICYTFLGLLLLVALLPSCATIEKPEIKEIEEKPKISKSIQHEKENIGNKKGLKRKVAIARFTNETKYGQSFFIDDNKDRIGKQAVDILSSKLVETEKFILLERADLDKITKELNMENYEPLKNMADYLIVGSITEFGRKDQGKVGIFSRTKRKAIAIIGM